MINFTKPNAGIVSIMLFFCLFACRRPDQASPNDNWCTSGINVLAIDDANVPGTVKSQIYAAPPSYTAVGNADYNPNLPVVIIPFRFPGILPFNDRVTTDVIRANFFATGVGSIRDYYSENSWGQYNISEGFIANGVVLTHDTAYYAAAAVARDWTRNPAVAKDICELSNVNWAGIDANHDHIISRHEAQICFMIASGGVGATRPSSVTISTQTGAYTINASFVYFDCKRNDDPTKGTDDIKYNYGGIWHEMSHGMFGLPDRYDTSRIAGTGRTGHIDLMSDNYSQKHLSIYDKMKIGWIRPRILVKPSQRADHLRHCYTFPNTETTPAALILWDANQPNEYWMVENRYKAGSARNFEPGLVESGLAIWWVDERRDSLSLVDARFLATYPQRITYSDYDNQLRALFKNRGGSRDESYNMMFLKSSYNSTEMAIRAVSPEGSTMFAEF